MANKLYNVQQPNRNTPKQNANAKAIVQTNWNWCGNRAIHRFGFDFFPSFLWFIFPRKGKMRSAYRLAFFPFLCHSMNFRSSFHILFECECDCGVTRCWGFFGFLSGWIETTTRREKNALYTWCSINKRFSLCNKRKLQNRIKSNKNITPKSTNVKWKKKYKMNVKKKRKWNGKNWTEKNCRRNTSNYTQNEENHSKWKDFINSIFVKRETQLEKIIKNGEKRI